MKRYVPLVLLMFAVVAVVLSLWGEDSYGRLLGLRQSLAAQKETNAELGEKVGQLKSRVMGLRGDDRELEKTARNELGMARPNELIFFFEKKGEESLNSGASGQKEGKSAR